MSLDFPWWVRVASWVMVEGNDGLTWLERKHLARRYVRNGAGRQPSKETLDAAAKWLERRKDNHGT